MSNFNEEIYNELKELGIEGKLVDISENDKGTPEDYAKLERRIVLKTYENEIMLQQSSLLAKRDFI